MKRDQIMECFNAFFEKYPEKRLIYKNRLEEMEHISKQYGINFLRHFLLLNFANWTRNITIH